MSEVEMRVVCDDEFGAVAAAVVDGVIVATASSAIEHGVYMAVDEGSVFQVTGQLLPAPLWDRAVRE